MQTSTITPSSERFSAFARTNWRIEITRALKDDAWDAFLAEVAGGHHVQSAAWAEIKAPLGWQVFRLKVLDEGKLIAGVQVLVVRKKLFGKLAFASKGPVFFEANQELAQYLLEGLQGLIKQEGIRYFVTQPPIMSPGLKNVLMQTGFTASDIKLAPKSTVIVDLQVSEDDLLMQMRKKTRQYIKRGLREGLRVREGSRKDMKAFYDLLRFSAKRLGFSPFAQTYYQDMWQTFKSGSVKTQDSTLFIAELNQEVITGLLVIGFNDTVITKTIGWTGLHATYHPNEAVYWAAIKWAKAKGYRYCDLEGIEDAAADSLLRGESLSEALRHTASFFKIGFGGEVTRVPHAYEYIPNPLLKWGYKTVLPKVENAAFVQKLLERIRTQNHGGR